MTTVAVRRPAAKRARTARLTRFAKSPLVAKTDRNGTSPTSQSSVTRKKKLDLPITASHTRGRSIAGCIAFHA